MSRLAIGVPLLLFIGFGWLVANFFLYLMVGQRFYIHLTEVAAAVLAGFVLLWVTGVGKPAVRRRLFLASLAVGIGIVTVHEIQAGYRHSLASVTDQVDLYEYRPFAEHTKAVVLGEASTLKLTGELPRLDGATALYPLYSAFAQAVYPEKEYLPYGGNSEVVCSTTSEAYKNLLLGRADLIFTAGPSKKQQEEAAAMGKELVLTPIGREAFVFFVNVRNPVRNLTLDQIKGIYSGEIRSWSGVGGEKEAVRAFQRPEDSGSQTMLQKLMEGRPLMSPPKEDVASGMGDIISRSADYRNYRNAIGYSFLFYATEMVKEGEIRLLAVNGVEPSRSTIRSGTYPLASEFYAVSLRDPGNPHVKEFTDWILSPQGQVLVEKTGYIPIQ
ncbi:substrate-binding domain-containing protein [Gorillibacterium sp. sgz5001074]|uniref:substrate-binding domain-containing protein n=1 Tax=Gorillibacterium sp. sgz5001074 TaxID=3446695 RepID=UPI003F67CBAE